jgi:hypothetical protein
MLPAGGAGAASVLCAAHVRFRRYRFPATDLNSKATICLGFNTTNQQLLLSI